MKLLNILTNDCKPQFKCGASLGVGEIISGVLGAGSSIIGASMQEDASTANVSRQLQAQKEENQKNRDWQTQQAEIARQFEAGQVLQQNQFQKDLQSQQQQYNIQSMQKQAQFNSPFYMRQQLEKSNINPQVYFGNHASFGGSSAVAGGSPSAPAGAKSPMPGSVAGLSPVGYQPSFLNLANIGANIAGTIKTLAEAKKLGVETSWIDDKMKAEIRKLTADSSLQDVLRIGQQITNQINNAKLPYAFEMAAKEVALAASQIQLNEQGKITQESVAKVNEALAKLHDAQKQLTDKEVEKMGIEMPYYVGVLKSTISKNSAEAKEASANVGLIEANAAQVKYYNEVLSSPGVKQSLVDEVKQAGKKAVADRKISEKQAEQMNYIVEQAAYATDMQEFTFWSNQINGFIGTIGQAASQFYGAGALRELIRLRQQGAKYGDSDFYPGSPAEKIFGNK